MKKSCPVMIDKERHLRYGLVAIDMIEEELDKAISQLDLANLRTKEAAVVIWAGLYHEDKELSPKQILELIDDSEADYTKIMEVVGEAISEAFDVKDEKK